MRKAIYTFIGTMVLLISLSSCSSTIARQALVQAERIVENNPDSALSVISDVEYGSLNHDEDKALYGLLYTEAMYKCYKHVASDSLIDFSIQHYTRVADKPRLAASYYYKGAVNDDRGDSKTAILWLKRAEELSEEIDDRQLKHKVYYLMCYANIESGNYMQTIESCKKLLKSSIEKGDEKDITISYNLIANAYYNMGNADSAVVFMQKGLPTIKKLNKQNQSIILANMGLVCYEIKRYSDALKYALASLKIGNASTGYLVLGYLCYDAKEYDKANDYWEKALQVEEEKSVKLDIYKPIIEYQIRCGNYKKAYDTYTKYVALEKTIQAEKETKEVLEIQLKYDKERITRELYQKTTIYLSIVIFLFVFILLLFKYYRNKEKHYKHTISDYSSNIESIKNEIEKYNEEIFLLKSSDGNKEKEIKKLQKKINFLHISMIDGLRKGCEIYERIRRKGTIVEYKDMDIVSLIDFYKIIKSDVFVSWEQEYDKLSTRQYLYLILHDMGYNDSDMSDILGVTEVSVRSMRSRIRKRNKIVANRDDK